MTTIDRFETASELCPCRFRLTRKKFSKAIDKVNRVDRVISHYQILTPVLEGLRYNRGHDQSMHERKGRLSSQNFHTHGKLMDGRK